MNKYMKLALKEAQKSLLTDDVPVGAIIVENGKVIAKAHNTKEKTKVVTRHAEINVVEKACKKKQNWYLNDCEMYVTLEPCKMCQGAIEQARIKKVFFAASRSKENISKSTFKKMEEGLEESQTLLKKFFENKRK